jgi:hypothetical protein
MAPAIGPVNMKWSGSPATDQGIIGFTAITSVGKIAGVIGTATMINVMTIATIGAMIAATTARIKSGNNATYQNAGLRAGVLFFPAVSFGLIRPSLYTPRVSVHAGKLLQPQYSEPARGPRRTVRFTIVRSHDGQ